MLIPIRCMTSTVSLSDKETYNVFNEFSYTTNLNCIYQTATESTTNGTEVIQNYFLFLIKANTNKFVYKKFDEQRFLSPL